LLLHVKGLGMIRRQHWRI